MYIDLRGAAPLGPLALERPVETKTRASEHKLLALGGLDLKFAEGDDEGTFTGYGAVFGNVDSYGDVIQKGAFKDTLRDIKKTGQWPAMLLQHGGFSAEDMTPIGIWTEMKEDDKGLLVTGKLAPTQRGQEVRALMKMDPRPAINGLSIGYRAKEFVIGTKPGEPRRTLKKVDLLEISVVTFPANTLAQVDSVKTNEFDPTAWEKAFRDEGLSIREAKLATSVVRKALLRDGGEPEPAQRDAAAVELLQSLRAATERLRA